MLSKEVVKQRIHQIKSKLAGLGIEHIGLFGSYSRNEQKPDSDIDILVSFKEGHESFDNLMEVSFLLEDIFEGLNVEIVTENGLSPYIGPKILKEVEYV